MTFSFKKMKHSPKLASTSGNVNDTFLPISTKLPPADPTSRQRRRKANKAVFGTASYFDKPIPINSQQYATLTSAKNPNLSLYSLLKLQMPRTHRSPGTLKEMHTSHRQREDHQNQIFHRKKGSFSKSREKRAGIMELRAGEKDW